MLLQKKNIYFFVGFVKILHLIGVEPIAVGPENQNSVQLSYKCFKYMIQQQTVLNVADNSGAKTVKCLKILGGFKRKLGFIGDILIVSVQQLRDQSKIYSKVKKGEIYKALIIKTRTKIKKIDNTYVFFNENSVSILNKQNNPIATRIIGPISIKLKQTKYQKFFSISAGFI